jgi:acyl-coenzyme A thioesterase PaaI-like protein
MPINQTRHLQLPHTNDCLVCGRLNPHGLKLDCFVDPETGVVKALFVPQQHHCGFAGVVHGGLLSTVLDEVMTWAATWSIKRFCYAGEMTVRFRQNVRADEPLQVEANVEQARSKLVLVDAKLVDSSGALVTTATGKYVPVSAEQHQRFVATLLDVSATRETLAALH